MRSRSRQTKPQEKVHHVSTACPFRLSPCLLSSIKFVHYCYYCNQFGLVSTFLRHTSTDSSISPMDKDPYSSKGSPPGGYYPPQAPPQAYGGYPPQGYGPNYPPPQGYYPPPQGYQQPYCPQRMLPQGCPVVPNLCSRFGMSGTFMNRG